MSQLQELDLIDFTGGLNARASQFQVADNESPRMLNMEIEPGRGFFTRKGWQRWNAADVMAPAAWLPRSSAIHQLSTGEFHVYISNAEAGGEVYSSDSSATFNPAGLGITCDATPHLADFAPWGDTMYIACGTRPTRKRVGAAAPASLTDASTAWHNDYTTPTGGTMPIAQHIAAHASYIFVAGTTEADPTAPPSGPHPNRVRWSHPDSPEDWAKDDYLDVDLGGGRITAIRSFQDHLLIFKTDSLWALYGYDLESWQLVQISRAIGAPSPEAVARSESATYFFSASGRNGVFSYDGNTVTEISVPLRPVLEELLPTRIADVWCGFVGRRLWVSVPWQQDDTAEGHSVGIFDPDSGAEGGVWIGARPALGSLRSIIEGSDVLAEAPLAVLSGDSGAACVLRLEFLDSASDQILADESLTPFFSEYLTNWKHLGKPELRKSFLRTRFLAPRQELDTQIRMDVYWDYDESTIRRSFRGLVVQSSAAVFWRALGADEPSGFDFKELGADDPSGRGADFGGSPGGSMLGRSITSLGVCRAIQLHFFTEGENAGRPWGFDGIFLKVRFRRFTT